MLKSQLNIDVIKGAHTVIFYWENGNRKWVDTRINGVRNGIYKMYFENGQIRTIGYFKEGVLDGHWRWYNKDGIMTGKGNYVNGKFYSTFINEENKVV